MKRITVSQRLSPAQIEQAYYSAKLVVMTVNGMIDSIRLCALVDDLSIDEKTMQLCIREDGGMICFEMKAAAI